MGKVTRRAIGVALLLAAVGCGAATVDGTAGDAAVWADAPAADLGAILPDATALDAGTTETPPDGTVSDVAPEARICPVVADDVPAPGAPYVVDLAVGAPLHQCALMSDGTVRCRGRNPYGQLGIGGSDLEDHGPSTVPCLANVEQIVTSSTGVTCTRHRDGLVRCWGSQQFDQVGTGPDGDDRCGSYACRTRPTLVPGLTDVVALGASQFSVCAARRDGSLWCWGSPYLMSSQRSTTPTLVPAHRDVVALWPRKQGYVLRHRDGSYLADLLFRPPAVPDDAIIDGDADSGHLCYLLPDGTARCVGTNADGQIGNGTSMWPGDVETPVDPALRGVRSIVTGYAHTCAVLADRTVSCWGSNEAGGLGVTSTERCAGITRPSDCATRPAPVPGVDDVARLFLGTWGTCALRLDHSVWCWGTLSPTRSRVPAPVAW